ncbi:unnamed protein product, partial [Amoebophrya sp. A25]|eukprot:GSA25T00016391001.1
MMFCGTLPYFAWASAISLAIGMSVTKASLMRFRCRAVEYLKRWRLEQLATLLASTPHSVLVLRIGHDGTPLGVTVSAAAGGCRAHWGQHRHNGEVFLATCSALIVSAQRGIMEVIKIPVDAVLLLRKRAGDLWPRISMILDTVEGVMRNSMVVNNLRAVLVYQVSDSGGAGLVMPRILRFWTKQPERVCDCTLAVNQFCGHHL